MTTIRDRGRVRKESFASRTPSPLPIREFDELQKGMSDAIESAADQARLELIRQAL